ncbi:MAG: amidohydrolase [Clostridiales bacterium]|nr:amidohydrolase [Clostridiales bacterium]
MNIEKWIEENKHTFCKISDEIWEHAELKFDEYKSADVLKRTLADEGFKLENTLKNMETAFIASYGSGYPVIGFLAEYDALDGQSQVADIFEQKKREAINEGHGCGHNIFGAASIGSAVSMKHYLDETGMSGTIKLFGCPGEEGGSGKAFMAREGVFDDLDVAIAWHPGSINGMFSVSTLANIQCYFKFKGKSSHAAASPHLGRSALDSVELMNVGVNYLREHIISDARVHYAVTNAGGISPNVVQAEAEVLYLIRAPKINQAKDIFKRVIKIAEGAAMMSETDVEVVFDKACSNIIPNSVLSEVMSDVGIGVPAMSFSEEENLYAKEYCKTLSEAEKKGNQTMMRLFGPKLNDELKFEFSKPLFEKFIPYFESKVVMPGSSDVGDVSWIVPTVQCMTACYSQNTPAHSWQMVAQGKSSIAHKGLVHASKIMAGTAVHILQNHDVIDAAKAELKDRLNGERYTSPIPADVKPRPYLK